MFNELFEKTRNTNEKVNQEDLAKLKPLVRKALAEDFTGGRLDDATDDVTAAMLGKFPDILTDGDYFSDTGEIIDKDGWEEFVFEVADREGY